MGTNSSKKTEEYSKEYTERFETLFETSLDAIFVADAETRKLVDCNKNAEKLIGRSKEEILSINADDLHPSDRIKDTMEGFKKQAEGKIKYVETEVLTKSGERIPVEVGAESFVSKGKSYLMGVFRDITERKQAEEGLKQKNMELERMNKLMTGRELKMIELKKEIEELKKRLGEA